MTGRTEVLQWLNVAKEKGATHMIVATDTFDYGDYPIFVMPHQSAESEVKRVRAMEMTRVMECYDMSLPLDDQLAERRAFHV